MPSWHTIKVDSLDDEDGDDDHSIDEDGDKVLVELTMIVIPYWRTSVALSPVMCRLSGYIHSGTPILSNSEFDDLKV